MTLLPSLSIVGTGSASRALRALALGAGIALVCPAALAQTPPKPPTQAPQTAVNVEIIILHATNDGSGIDPKIGKMPELAQPPFSSYNSYKLLDRKTLALTKGNAQTHVLPNARPMMVTLKDVIEPKKREDARRYLLNAVIQKPNGKEYLPLLDVNAVAGQTFFIAGQSYKGGMLVIGVKVLP